MNGVCGGGWDGSGSKCRGKKLPTSTTQIGRKANWSVIETRQGNLRLHEGLWNNLRELRDIVQRKATNAKTTEWAIYGSRPCDLPREFRYDEQRIRELLQSF